jgi:hypothetical protein
MKTNILIFFIVLIALHTASCKKFVELDSPKNQLTTDKVFIDSTNADGAIIGIYYTFMGGSNILSAAATIYKGLAADELVASAPGEQQEFYNNNITVGNSFNGGLWTGAYKYIYQSNAAIEGIGQSKGISDSAKRKLIAELKCIRAYLYFQLVNLYGGVPMVLTPDLNDNINLPRASEDQTLSQIALDLQAAQEGLPKEGFVRWRANYYAATALLAKVRLQQKNYQAAITEAQKVTDSGLFPLQSDLNQVFAADSQEGIWTLIPSFPGLETWEGFAFVPTSNSVQPRYTINTHLMNSFTANDQRKIAWIKMNAVAGQDYYYPYKYKQATRSGSPTEHYQFLRSADIYLVLAEACINANRLSEATAYLNVVRSRAGLSNFISTIPSSVLSEILLQRKLEMFCEQGSRWNDLRRTLLIDAALQPLKPGWKATDEYFPIPQSEIRANSALVQNAGY